MSIGDPLNGYVWRNGEWVRITRTYDRDGGSWESQEGYVWHDGEWHRFTGETGIIEDFEGSTTVSDQFREPSYGNGTAQIDTDHALVRDLGSTQGLELKDRIDVWQKPGDEGLHEETLQAGKTARFFFRPRKLGTREYYFLLGCQPDADEPTKECYRFEFEADCGSRICKLHDGHSHTLDYEYQTWFKSYVYEVRFSADDDGVRFSYGTRGDMKRHLKARDTEFVDDEMAFGFGCCDDGHVEWDWLGYI